MGRQIHRSAGRNLSSLDSGTVRRRGVQPFTPKDAIEALRDSELVVYPTETFYALGADPTSETALGRLFAAKGRQARNAVALIAADTMMAFELARSVPPAACRLAEAFWPGPLTLVLPAKQELPDALVGAGGGVGVRVSSHPVARGLARRLGRPLTATSANRSGQAPARTLGQARAALGGKVKVFLEGGTLAAAAPSTVIAFEHGRIKVLRAGAISEHQLAAALATKGLK